MPYIKRDKNNNITALYTEPPFDDAECLPAHHDDVIKFLNEYSDDQSSLKFLNGSDYELVRVLEDLIELLMNKNLILFTELPTAAQQKLVQRRHARDNLREIDVFALSSDR